MTREALTEAFSDFVGRVVSKTLAGLAIRIEREDLESYGMLGLYEAHDRFDPESGAEFSTFAYYRVRGAILDGCRKEGWLTRERQKKNAKTMRSVDAYMEDVGRERESTGAAKSLNDAVNRVSDVVSTAATIVLMQESDWTDFVASQEATQETELEEKQTQALLQQALKELNDEERDVIVRFDFNNERMEDIGAEYGYSKAWVSRVRTRALNRMRAYITHRQ